jgi:hypothetical protein
MFSRNHPAFADWEIIPFTYNPEEQPPVAVKDIL